MADPKYTDRSPDRELAMLAVAESDLITAFAGENLKDVVDAVERVFLLRAILEYSGNVRQAARAVGLAEQTFVHKCERLYAAAVEAPARLGGYVYVVRDVRLACKIGKTRGLCQRIVDLRHHSSGPLEFLGAIETKNPDGLERHYHEVFAEKRLRGEWYVLTDDDIARILGDEGTARRFATEDALRRANQRTAPKRRAARAPGPA